MADKIFASQEQSVYGNNVTPMYKSTPAVQTQNRANKSIQKNPNELLEDQMTLHKKGYRMTRSELQVIQHLNAELIGETNTANITLDRIYERFEVLIQEQRTTNVLLSQLTALHAQIAGIDINNLFDHAEGIREGAYGRVSRGE